MGGTPHGGCGRQAGVGPATHAATCRQGVHLFVCLAVDGTGPANPCTRHHRAFSQHWSRCAPTTRAARPSSHAPPGQSSQRSRYLLAVACIQLSRYLEAREALLKMGEAEVRRPGAEPGGRAGNKVQIGPCGCRGPVLIWVKPSRMATHVRLQCQHARLPRACMGIYIHARAPPPLPPQIPFGASGLFLLGKVCRLTGRTAEAKDYYCRALRLNPIMWSAFEDLCAIGELLRPQRRARLGGTRGTQCVPACMECAFRPCIACVGAGGCTSYACKPAGGFMMGSIVAMHRHVPPWLVWPSRRGPVRPCMPCACLCIRWGRGGGGDLQPRSLHQQAHQQRRGRAHPFLILPSQCGRGTHATPPRAAAAPSDAGRGRGPAGVAPS